jgi:hypothetical protein
MLVSWVMWSCRQIPTFRRNILPPSSGLKMTEDGGSMFHRTVGICLQVHMAPSLAVRSVPTADSLCIFNTAAHRTV